MANNELVVVIAGGANKTLRDDELSPGIHAQGVMVWEGGEVPVSVTGGTVKYVNIDNSPAVALDPPNAAARFARLRVYENSLSPSLRLYYRTDGTPPSADGTNAFGFLLHGEMILIKLANMANFQMIAEGAGIWQGYVEWFNAISS